MKVIPILLVSLFVGTMLISASSSAFVLPSFEGPNAYFFGFQPWWSGSTVYTANNNAPCNECSSVPVVSINAYGNIPGNPSGYSDTWSYDPANPTIEACQSPPTYSPGCVGLGITVTSSQMINPITGNNVIEPLSYEVPDPYDPSCQHGVTSQCQHFVQVNGQIVQNEIDVVITVAQNSETYNPFKNDNLWIELFSTTWNNYYPLTQYTNLPNGTLTGAWSAPLLLQLINAKDTTADYSGQPNDATNPGVATTNNQIALFSTPLPTSSFTSPISSSNQISNANQTVYSQNNPFAPDTFLQQQAFLRISLQNVAAYTCGPWYGSHPCYPNIVLRFQEYSLQLGRYLWTNPVHSGVNSTGYQGGCQNFFCNFGNGVNDFFSGISSWFSNPFNLTGIGIWLIVVILGLGGLTLFWFFGLPKGRRA